MQLAAGLLIPRNLSIYMSINEFVASYEVKLLVIVQRICEINEIDFMVCAVLRIHYREHRDYHDDIQKKQ